MDQKVVRVFGRIEKKNMTESEEGEGEGEGGLAF